MGNTLKEKLIINASLIGFIISVIQILPIAIPYLGISSLIFVFVLRMLFWALGLTLCIVGLIKSKKNKRDRLLSIIGIIISSYIGISRFFTGFLFALATG